ncbi:MAG: response regulator [Verrucomicrobium sp.]|nr:response regulator [Verrucomicrobium sp.]
MKILLIEDEAADFKLAHSILSGEGHEILGAHSAEEAMTILETERPQVILTDLQLPHMDGVTFTLRIRQAPETASIPVVGVTAHPDQLGGRHWRQAGFTAFVVKPVSHRSLPRQVEEAARMAA